MRTLLTIAGMFGALVLAGCGAKSADELLAEGDNLLRNSDTYGAEVKFQQVIEKYPGTRQAMIARGGLAEIYKQTNDPANAVAQYDLLIQEMGGAQTPEGFQAFFAKVQVPAMQRDYKGAIAMVLETSPTMRGIPADGEVSFLGNLMSLYLLDGQIDKAHEILDAFERIAMANPDMQPIIVSILGNAARTPEMAPSVIEFHKNLVAKNADSPLKARILFELFRLEDALDHKDEAREHLNAAIAAQQGLLEKAIGEEETSGALLNLGNLYQVGGEADKAREQYNKVIEQYPQSPNVSLALHFMADLDVMAGDFAAAEKRLRQVETQFPNTPQAAQALQKITMLANRSSTGTLTAPEVQGPPVGAAAIDAPMVDAPVIEGPLSPLTTSTAVQP